MWSYIRIVKRTVRTRTSLQPIVIFSVDEDNIINGRGLFAFYDNSRSVISWPLYAVSRDSWYARSFRLKDVSYKIHFRVFQNASHFLTILRGLIRLNKNRPAGFSMTKIATIYKFWSNSILIGLRENSRDKHMN